MQQLAGIKEIKVMSPGESYGINSKGEWITFTVDDSFTINANNKDLVKLVIKDKIVKHVFCYNNKLTSLDVSNLPSLKVLSCRENYLTSLTLSNPNLVNLICYGNELTSLDISNSPNLRNTSYDETTKLIK
jgi:hypothetical protein